MKKIKKMLALMLTAAMLMGTLAACGSQEAAESTDGQETAADASASGAETAGSDEEKVFTIALSSNIYTVNIGQADSGGEPAVFHLMYDKWIRIMPDGSYEGRLIENWEWSDDALVCSLTIRDGVKFHNGEDFNAEAVKVTLDYLKDDTTLSLHSQLAGKIDHVDIVDDLHVDVHFSEVDTQWIATLATTLNGYIAPKAFAEAGSPEKYFEHPYGCGMFSFVSFDPGSTLVMEKDPNFEYWDTSAKNNFDKIVVKVIGEDLTKVAALQTGEVDMINSIPYEQYENVKSIPGVTFEEIPGTLGWWIGMECGEGYVFNDINARKAVSLCFDRDLIASSIYGNAVAMDGFVTPNCNGYTQGEYYRYDPEAAKQYLADSNYDGTPIRLIAVNNFQKITELSQAMVSMLEAVGFNVELQMIEHSALNDTREQGLYDIFISACQFADDCTNFCNIQVVTDRGHFELNNAELNAVISEAAATVDETKRAELLKEATAMAAELCAPIQPLFMMTATIAVKDTISGYVFYPDNSMWLMDMVTE